MAHPMMIYLHVLNRSGLGVQNPTVLS
jgi:hypothetical protein